MILAARRFDATSKPTPLWARRIRAAGDLTMPFFSNNYSLQATKRR